MPAIVRSVLAVITGYAAMAIVVMAMTVIAKKMAPRWMGAEGAPTASYICTNLCYSFVAAMIGGYVAAAIGSRAPLAHAFVLAVLVLVLAIVSATQTGDRQPRSYQIALAIVGPIGCIIGGWLRARS